jgi:predicted hydrocarbon binding protein
VSAAADLGSGDERALQRGLGVDLGAALYDTYESQIDADWGYFDLLGSVESVHEAARAGGDAEPPHLAVEHDGDDRIAITYGSDRRLCDVGKGIAEGLADAYGVNVDVRERSCMLEGDRECELVLERA